LILGHARIIETIKMNCSVGYAAAQCVCLAKYMEIMLKVLWLVINYLKYQITT
jgi:hypothetical protein